LLSGCVRTFVVMALFTRTPTAVLAAGNWLIENDSLVRQKTDHAIHALAVDHALADGDGVAGQLDAFADAAAVAAGFGDGRGGHDRWLQVAVDP
jgi:hypothetical protein